MPSHDESFAALFEQSKSARTGDRRYTTGERIEVTVVALAREAVFADLGGKQEGMFERAELVDESGALCVEVGSRITAIVRSVDFGTGQVHLSPVAVRRTQEDAPTAVVPAAAAPAGAAVVEGARVKGKVTGIERYGVFVQIAGTHGRNGRGLVPTAETGTPRGADLKKHFAVGQDVEAKVLHVEAETGRIRLSVSALANDDERRDYESFKATGEVAGTSAEPAAAARGSKPQPKREPPPKNFGTLGDLLAKRAPAPSAPAEKPARRPVKKR